MADQQFSVVNRVRFTAWAWLVSAFLVGLTVGAVGTGVPLSMRLADANASLTRQIQVRQLEEGLDPAGDLAALSSGGAAVGLEIASGARGAAGASASVSPAAPRISQLTEFAQQAAPILPAAGTGALKPLGAEAIQSSGAPVASVSLEAPVIPASNNQPPAQRASTAPAPATAPTPPPAGKPGDDQRRASRTAPDVKIAEERERKAKEEREEHRQKVEREQQASAAKKAAQEAGQRERDEAAARAVAARAKLVTDSRPAGRPEVPPAPAPATGAGSGAAPGSAGAPAAAAMNSPTERVTKDEAGLAEVQAGSVTFKSGRRVNVGDNFPSGEKLISVDPALGEIVTSRRRIVIKAS